MLTLFVKSGCPYCAKVLMAAEELGLSFEEKNIADDAVAEELIALGGTRQVPYLVDSDRSVAMYESDDIVEYLRAHYGSHPLETEGETVPAHDGEEL
ncbi:hypothetical protein A3C89_00705 [Candidatus Kaiserbacteria bacterium RIFCSPHIGHO2_02_FULL_50_50]|uniref:GST N-terminal domain-containing protein n=1 Tax=Candidatus Kaiserbacteria bacterium RIFCSPHIGHO2_02_FULL_50_50 TaxID=1798492 RepID=A0A1F6DFS0_9BACT|nr:MAG: hypothetical protein A3C89_00705 [Candidatus Kaiserbacteria bacterium RIFCSPHIGHO2_02_FULL_50_50]OGG88871.1 MAG: hypothetical protein A3G62_03145 [Candidatus Kaiserbacteria bacterium RIFCSPLOWO2_12_FULL_50_10]